MKDHKINKLSLRIISQSFYPDIVATGELLYELAVKIHNDFNVEVSVLTAQPSFVIKDNLPSEENINGIKVKRLNIFKFDKNSLIGKIFNAHSFFYFAMHYLNWSKKTDWLLIPTSPPLLPLLGTYLKFTKRQRYVFLMHDMYPEIAEKLGYIRKDGIFYKGWDFLSKLSLKAADKIIVLSDDMKAGILNWVKNIDPNKITVIHNWADEELIKPIVKKENFFIEKFEMQGKFIVEYSGNIGRIHEFKTIIDAARQLKDNEDIIFLFIGDGGRKDEVESLVKAYQLNNVKFIPYQKREDLGYSLGMADIHVLSLLDEYKHLAAPSKLYGILASGKPVIFVGSKDCYITKILEYNRCGVQVEIGNYKKIEEFVLQLKSNSEEWNSFAINSRSCFEKQYTLSNISEQFIDLLNN